MGLASVLWVAAGYFSFSGTGAFIGIIDKLFFQQVSMMAGREPRKDCLRPFQDARPIHIKVDPYKWLGSGQP